MKIDVDGRSVSYESTGQGPALLLLHAFPLSSRHWANTAAALAPRFRVVAVDAPGFGASAPFAGALTMERLATDAAAVLDHLEIPKAIVGGCSMGGYAAFAFTRLYSERLSGLVLVDTRPAPDTAEGRGGREALAKKVQAQGVSAVVEAMLPKLVGATSHRERPAVVAGVRGMIEAAAPAAIVNALGALAGRADSRPSLSAIRVPTLIVRGAEDEIISAADTTEMERGIAGSRALTIPGAGHLSNLEAPDAFTAAVSDFLAQAFP
jgi:3-oxoadipate enol-lactonase